MPTTFTIKININRHIKKVLEILCLKTNIANKPPNAPPMVAIVKSSFSGILLLFFIANNLSIPKRRKLIPLIDIR